MKLNTTKIPNIPWDTVNDHGYHTKPFGHIEHNGLNFRFSVTNKNSRLHKMLNYLHTNSDKFVNKREILSNVFHRNGEVSRGWGVYLFTLSVKCGFVRMIRKGNNVYYIITEKGKEVIGV